jgi:F0F1-type ATP synthase assembly protein I
VPHQLSSVATACVDGSKHFGFRDFVCGGCCRMLAFAVMVGCIAMLNHAALRLHVCGSLTQGSYDTVAIVLKR